VASLATKHLPTGRGCLCKNAHSATRRDCRSGLSFCYERGTQPIVCWECLIHCINLGQQLVEHVVAAVLTEDRSQ
jgi:hypothetical protein